MERRTFPTFFNPEDLGKSLKEVATDLIRTTHQDVISRWFHGSQEVDLFIWLDTRQNIIKQQVSFYGQVVEWNVLEGVKTGMVVQDDRERDGGRYKSSEVIQFDGRAQRESIAQANLLIESVDGLDPAERRRLIENFNQPSPRDFDAEDFVRKFGAFLGSPQGTPREVSLWTRVLRFFKR